MKALVIGATGVTGKNLVQVLLQDPDYSQVTIFVRRATGHVHAKLVEVLTDFDKLENVSDHIRGDIWFSCLGTTLKAAGAKEKQWHIDYEIPAAFAEIAKRNGVSKAVLLSAYGASTTARLFYSKMKGALEAKIIHLSFGQCIIFRPGLLLRKDTDRLGERISAGLLKVLNGVGILRRFRPMPTLLLAEKMAKAAKVDFERVEFVELDKIFEV